MRKILGPTLVGVAAAALVAGSIGGQTASATGGSPDRDKRGDVVSQALRALDAHPAVARDTVEQEFQVVDTVLDADGASHVRMTRTVHGLPVIGGDIVVHQSGGGAWQGVSQTLRTPLDLSVRPTLDKAAAEVRALARLDRDPGDLEAPLRGRSAAGRRRRLRQAPARLGGVHRRAPAGRHTEPAAQLRGRRHGQGAAPRGADPHHGRLRSVPLQRHREHPGRPRRLRLHPHRPRARQRRHRRCTEQDRLDPLPAARHQLCEGRRLQQPGHLVRQRGHEQPRVGCGGRALRRGHDVRLLQDPARPQRDLRRRPRRDQPGPLRQRLRQRLLGRLAR